MEPLLLVGLDEPETTELRQRLDRPVLAFETLPRIRVGSEEPLGHPALPGPRTAPGLLLGLFGWALVFRSGIGVLVSLLLIPPLVARMNAEEALLESEFGERFTEYRRRTWRLVP